MRVRFRAGQVAAESFDGIRLTRNPLMKVRQLWFRMSRECAMHHAPARVTGDVPVRAFLNEWEYFASGPFPPYAFYFQRRGVGAA